MRATLHDCTPGLGKFHHFGESAAARNRRIAYETVIVDAGPAQNALVVIAQAAEIIAREIFERPSEKSEKIGTCAR